MRCWCGHLSGARCKGFAYDIADVTATQDYLVSLKSSMVESFQCRLTQIVLKKRPLNGCLYVWIRKVLEVAPRVFLRVQKDDVESLAGYLSLHQSAAGLSLKWTPNQLMNGASADDDDISVDRRWAEAATAAVDLMCPVAFPGFYFVGINLTIARKQLLCRYNKLQYCTFTMTC